jgi:hypothetical protein
MFSLETRKQHTKIILKLIQNFLFRFTGNDFVSGVIICVLHTVMGLPSLLYLIMGKVNLIYYLCFHIWATIFVLHFYFNGCIFTRAERYLWNDKEWWGPWMVLFYPLKKLNINITGNMANNIFLCWGFTLCTFVLLKIYHIL